MSNAELTEAVSAFGISHLALITDPSDPRLAPYRDVGDPSALTRNGLFVVEGRLPVERLLESGRFGIASVAVTPVAAQAMAPLLELRCDVHVYVCEPAILEAVTGFDFHRGCLALARRPLVLPPLDDFAPASRVLALEGVGNPDNIGGLFRTAFALGVDAVVLDPTSGDPLYRKAIRTSMAASLRVPFTRVERWPAALEVLRGHGLRVVALTPDPEATSLDDYEAGRNDRLVLLVGAEGPGLTAGSMKYADVKLRIPIDPRADSLNVVVAAGIVLHALRQKR
jgi:tRNA G18 (ribose-2'-O)-methylase SpoU